MAEPISVIGTVGAIAGLTDVLGRTIKSLKELNDRWKDADLILLSLVTQLKILRGALDRIHDWLESAPEVFHYQLQMDLTASTNCCELLINKMDAFVAKIGHSNSHECSHLDIKGKFKVVFGGYSMKEIRQMIDDQINAMNLLLTTCSCQSSMEQKALLEKSTSRMIFKRVRDDSSSLYCLRDTNSFRARSISQLTATSSRFSTVSKWSSRFDFDNILFGTNVYKIIIYSSLKERFRQKSVKHVSQNVESQAALQHAKAEEILGSTQSQENLGKTGVGQSIQRQKVQENFRRESIHGRSAPFLLVGFRRA